MNQANVHRSLTASMVFAIVDFSAFATRTGGRTCVSFAAKGQPFFVVSLIYHTFLQLSEKSKFLKNNGTKLLTSGTLWMPIDGIRFVTNHNSMMEYCVLSVFTDFSVDRCAKCGKIFGFRDLLKNDLK